MILLGKIVSYLLYLGRGLRRGLQGNHGTVRKSAISPQPGNQKQIKWNNTAYLNKRRFMFKIKFCISSNKDLIL